MKHFLTTPIHRALLGNDNPRPGDVGVEIEAEFIEEYHIGVTKNFSSWLVKQDPSLRNYAREFVTKGALPIDFFNKDALDQWEKYAKTAKFHNTARTSVHVHLNFQNYTGLGIFTFLTAAWFFEDFLVSFCKPQRVGNVFCLRSRDAEFGILSLMGDMSRCSPFPQNFMSDNTRYSAINGKALQDFGSIEFRCMRGVYKREEIAEWVNLLYNLQQKAKEYHHPREIIGEFLKVDLENFCSKFFEPWFVSFIRTHLGWKSMLQEKFLLLQAFSHEVQQALDAPDQPVPNFYKQVAKNFANVRLIDREAPRWQLMEDRNPILNENQWFEHDGFANNRIFIDNPPGDR